MTETRRRVNPFIYDRPVPPLSFFGRRDMLRAVFSKLYTGQSVAILGEPHIGKSSLLNYLADEAVRERWLSGAPAWYFFTMVDCQAIPAEATPADFWREALTALPYAINHDLLTSMWHVAADNLFGAFVLDQLFRMVAQAGWRVVLALDHFEALLNDHPHFNAEFFGALRAHAANTGALSLIVTSRAALATIHQHLHCLNPHDFPFFNSFIDLRLLPFTTEEYDKLVDTLLAGTGVSFSEMDNAFILDIAGRQPFLTQVAAAGLFDAYGAKLSATARYFAAGKLFHDRAESHFAALWSLLSPTDQTALVLLTLPEIKSHLNGHDFVAADLGRLEWYGPALTHLRELGIVERVERSVGLVGLTFWQGASWRIAARGLAWWIAEHVLDQAAHGQRFDQWLHDKERQGMFNSAQAELVCGAVSAIPRDVYSSSVPMIRSVVRELLK